MGTSDSDDPRTESKQDEDKNGVEIEEPPIKMEDTRPLKPLKVERRKPDSRSLEPTEPESSSYPPATVLQEASSPPSEKELTPPPSSLEETDRVRLVPRSPEPAAWRLILQIVEPHSARLGLNVWQQMVIGRIGPYGKDTPDLDLAPHQAAELGVSRQHAALIPAEDALYLIDMDSTNGTWINEQYLQPGLRRRLEEGDRIELGLLVMEVRTLAPLSRETGA